MKNNVRQSFSDEHLLYLKKERRNKNIIIGGRILVLLIFLGLWELLTITKAIDSFIYSSPSRIVKMLIQLFQEGDILKHTFVTLYETILAFVISMVVGTIIAILLFSSERARNILEPYLVILNSLPKVALGPLIIVWFGAGTKAIVVMGFLICIIITIVSLLNSFMSVSKEKILLLKTLGANRWQILTKLVIPESLPSFISVLKINVGMSWVGTIMGEYLVSKAGLGYLIVYGGYIFKLDLVMTAILILCLLAGLMYLLVSMLEKFLIKKRGSNKKK
ncbi:MAG: ABC transporter permease [Clostridia bacterium]|nr:ABC transporter permease [Clostridia bacterium]